MEETQIAPNTGSWRRNICIQSSPLQMASKGGILASNLLALVRLLERDLSSGALRTPELAGVLCFAEKVSAGGRQQWVV